MKIALSWLTPYLRTSIDVETISFALTGMGLEVEHIEGYAPVIDGVVVAHILRFEPHPSADKLRVATVFDGEKELQIVCGDLSCPENVKVPLASIGARLPGGFEIKKAKLRGVESMGMLCSLDELGFKESSEGVYVLPQEAVVGENAFKWLNDPVLCLSLTPNLGYCLSIESVAKQLAAKMELPFYSLEKTPLSHISQELVAPKVKNTSGKCSSYQCLLIEKVKGIESPHWLARCMQQAGYRSVNALVDAANWVMLEMGRPIHLFDADTLKGDLEVSLLTSEKSFSRIDGVDQNLKPGTLVISDESGPVAVAGVMGSRLHEVGSLTTRVLMEVAVFDPSAVRKSAKAIGCTSEASRRFERGVDPTSNELAFERFIQILKSMGFSPLVGSFSGFTSALSTQREITLSSKLVYRLLNVRMGSQEISKWLSRLDISCRILDEETLIAKPSLARHDLVIAQDLVEELMKLIGTENLPRQMLNVHLGSASHDPRYLISQSIRQLFWGRGLKEVVTLDMVSGQKCKNFCFETSVELKNPLSVEADVLRPSLLISFLETLTQNRDQQIKDVGIFEIGSVYSKNGSKTQEQLALGLLITGQKTASHWSQESEHFDFYDIKGSVEQLLDYVGAECCFKSSSFSTFHPGQQAKICSKEGFVIGHIGRLHPRYEKSLGVDYPVFYAEIGIEDLLKVKNSLCQHRTLDQYPGSERDWTLTLNESVSFEEVLASFPVLEQLERVELVSIWRCPEKLGFDYKNLTLRFYYRHRDKTMTQSEVESQHLLLKETVSRKLNLKN